MNEQRFKTVSEAIQAGYMRPGFPRVVEHYKGKDIRISDISGENSYGYVYAVMVNGQTFCKTTRIWCSEEFTMSGTQGAYQAMFYKPDYDKGLEAAGKFIDSL
jgi:hypothetical protein